jgi:starch-binding outer membrane protein SusE/F
MKKFLLNGVLVAATTLLFTACKKDEDKTFLNASGGALTLTGQNGPSLATLSEATGGQNSLALSWNKADFGYDAAVKYALQISKKNTNFAPATTTDINLTTLSKNFKEEDINKELIKVIPYGIANDVEFRIKATVGASVAPKFSNILSYSAKPYRALINYNFPNALRVAGNYQGWSPGTAPKIVDPSATPGNNFEGYINFNNANPEFKLVKGNDWPDGDHGDAGNGALTSQGGNNLTLTNGAGIYLLRANRTGLTWSATKINTWGIIGSATPNGWNGSTAMTYNAGNGTYTITTNLTVGEIKFRANDGWAINFGDSGNNGSMEYDGANIPVTEAGNYSITFDVSVAGNYFYLIKKN